MSKSRFWVVMNVSVSEDASVDLPRVDSLTCRSYRVNTGSCLLVPLRVCDLVGGFFKVSDFDTPCSLRGASFVLNSCGFAIPPPATVF